MGIWRNGRRWGLKILWSLRPCGFKSHYPHHLILCVCGCVAQLVRALRSHRRGRWFESNHIHHEIWIKNPSIDGSFIILTPWRGNMQMRHCANLNIVCGGCVNLAMVANRCIFYCCRCRCIWHIGAMCMFGLMFCPCLLCILQQRFDSWHHFCPVLWMITVDMRLRRQ